MIQHAPRDWMQNLSLELSFTGFYQSLFLLEDFSVLYIFQQKLILFIPGGPILDFIVRNQDLGLTAQNYEELVSVVLYVEHLLPLFEFLNLHDLNYLIEIR